MKLILTFAIGVLLSILASSSMAAPALQADLSPVVLGTANDSDFDGQWDTYHPSCCLAYNGLPTEGSAFIVVRDAYKPTLP